MRVFVTGATGLIGRALLPELRRQGWEVSAWVRRDPGAALGPGVEAVSASGGDGALRAALERCDAVLNLAGEPILGGRWTPARRRALRGSRVGLTEQIVAAMAAAHPGPQVLVSASAVGYYGDRGDEMLEESSSPGNDFLARLCQAWESAARTAETFGVRVVLVRTGMVLAPRGGALAQMLPPFRWGLGGPIGNGRQFLPWIHLEDEVRILLAALAGESWRGPCNAVAPHAVTSRQFAATLGHTLRRPARFRVPAWALRLRFGGGSQVLLASQRVEPAALRARGFNFAFPTLAGALAGLLPASS